MPAWVALLRGINVSGKNLISMKALKESIDPQRFRHFHTYLQSGNLLWTSEENFSDTEWATILHNHLQAHFHLTVPVLCFPAQEWLRFCQNIPWPEAAQNDGSRYLLCLSQSLQKELSTAELTQWTQAEDLLHWRAPVLYLYLPKGQGNTKLSIQHLERWAGSTCSLRNWKTSLALSQWLQSHSP